MNRISYTAITPGYDKPRTDVKCLIPENVFAAKTMNARAYKVLPHVYLAGYDEYMWIDGNVFLTKEHDYYFDRYLKGYDIATFKHPFRTTVTEEVEVLKRMPYYPRITAVDSQIRKYVSEGYIDNALYASYVFMSRASEQVMVFFNAWWKELVCWQYRDQVSLPYVLSRFPQLKVNIIGNDVLKHPDFIYRKHGV